MHFVGWLYSIKPWCECGMASAQWQSRHIKCEKVHQSTHTVLGIRKKQLTYRFVIFSSSKQILDWSIHICSVVVTTTKPTTDQHVDCVLLRSCPGLVFVILFRLILRCILQVLDDHRLLQTTTLFLSLSDHYSHTCRRRLYLRVHKREEVI